MFYCNKCADDNGYPITAARSFGLCEICEIIQDCNDCWSRLLPKPKWATEEGGATVTKGKKEI